MLSDRNERKVVCLIGNVLKERYCIVEQLGHGGGGSLYLAKDMELGICRAVKEIPIAKKKEARLMQYLEYPAIPKIIDYVETGENCYLIMEYIKGQSLGELLRSGKRFSLREILALGKEIARVLEYLHSRKPPVCYGDLKPDNLMFSETGHLYLIDLGSAMFDHGKIKQICEGTKGYAAPEQYQGYLRPGSDIYALGKTLEKLCRKKKWQWILYPDFFWFLFRCTRKQEKYRYSDMSVVQKKIQKLENRYRTITWRKRFLEAVAAGILIGTLLLIAGTLKPEEFSIVISEVTDLYYEARQYPEDSKGRKKCCIEAEKKLQKLNRNYGEKEQQRRIELLLACNAELLDEPEKAALYYENLLLYDAEYPVAYGEYGMFLIRTGQKEASRKLWEDYKKKEKAKLLDDSESRNLKLWEEINEKKKRK
ncbi:serine/threonine protein kinase [Ruminococcus sp. AF20-12LB]|nr:serine/threonine protein kinase [Ruminococcus sp. AF20-12LB]